MDPVTRDDQPALSRRFQRLTAVLDRRRKIMTEGVDSTMEAYTEAIEELLRRTNAAHHQGLELPRFLSILRDQDLALRNRRQHLR